MLNSKLKIVTPIIEKDEQATILEEELCPMNYAKVFSEDKYITNKPAHEGRKILKQHFEEVFENKCYASVQKKKE